MSIKLDIVHKVDLYLLITLKDRITVVDACINKALIVIQLSFSCNISIFVASAHLVL
jgi:hypothetical protein